MIRYLRRWWASCLSRPEQIADHLIVGADAAMTDSPPTGLQQNLEQLEKTINLNKRTELRKRIVIYGPPLFCSVNNED
jgi:hypothetical protein